MQHQCPTNAVHVQCQCSTCAVPVLLRCVVHLRFRCNSGFRPRKRHIVQFSARANNAQLQLSSQAEHCTLCSVVFRLCARGPRPHSGGPCTCPAPPPSQRLGPRLPAHLWHKCPYHGQTKCCLQTYGCMQTCRRSVGSNKQNTAHCAIFRPASSDSATQRTQIVPRQCLYNTHAAHMHYQCRTREAPMQLLCITSMAEVQVQHQCSSAVVPRQHLCSTRVVPLPVSRPACDAQMSDANESALPGRIATTSPLEEDGLPPRRDLRVAACLQGDVRHSRHHVCCGHP